MTDTYLGQIFTTHPFRPDEAPHWMDYARGQREETIAWAQQDPEKRRVVDWIEKSKVLWPVEVPVPDNPILRQMMQGIGSLWGGGREMVSWRENEYARGQVELILETCRVITDDELAAGEIEGEELKDRVWGWIKNQQWDGPLLLTEDEWKQIPEYAESGDWGSDINERRPVIVMWHDPTETPSQAVERLNTEVMQQSRIGRTYEQRLHAVLDLFTENPETRPLFDDAAGVDQDHVKMYASPEWYQRYVALMKTIRTELGR